MVSGPVRYEGLRVRPEEPLGDLDSWPETAGTSLSSWWREARFGHPWARDDESPREFRPAADEMIVVDDGSRELSTPVETAASGRRPCMALGRGRT